MGCRYLCKVNYIPQGDKTLVLLSNNGLMQMFCSAEIILTSSAGIRTNTRLNLSREINPKPQSKCKNPFCFIMIHRPKCNCDEIFSLCIWINIRRGPEAISVSFLMLLYFIIQSYTVMFCFRRYCLFSFLFFCSSFHC